MIMPYYSITRYYEPLTLWADDLIKITKLLSANDAKLTIDSGAVSYESYSGLKADADKKTLTSLSVSSIDCGIDIELSTSVANIRLFTEKSPNIYIFYQIDELLRACEQTPRILYDSFAPNLLIYPSPLLSFAGGFFTIFSVVMLSMAACWWLFIFWKKQNNRSTVHIMQRYDAKSIARDYLPAVLTSVTAAGLGALVTVILQYLFRKH